MKRIAIIPARGGSKRIPRKNIRDFLGKPIIAYSIEAAVNSKLFDSVIVSTDDDQIAEIAVSFGAEVPFFRSSENSNDYATLADVLNEVLVELELTETDIESICCILPTAALTSSTDLKASYDLFSTENFDVVMPVVRYGYPIQRSLKLNENKTVDFANPENLNARSQDLEPRYHDSGQYYWLDVTAFKKTKQFFGSNTGAIVISENQVQDIDNEEDWKLAELKFKAIFG